MKKCPYCLGLGAFCVAQFSGYGSSMLFSLRVYKLELKNVLCPWYNNGELSEHCKTCIGRCPMCNGSGKHDWINEMFITPNEDKPTKEDFEKLRDYFLGDGRTRYNLSDEFIEYLEEE